MEHKDVFPVVESMTEIVMVKNNALLEDNFNL